MEVLFDKMQFILQNHYDKQSIGEHLEQANMKKRKKNKRLKVDDDGGGDGGGGVGNSRVMKPLRATTDRDRGWQSTDRKNEEDGEMAFKVKN